MESTVRYLGGELEDPLAIAEAMEIQQTGRLTGTTLGSPNPFKPCVKRIPFARLLGACIDAMSRYQALAASQTPRNIGK